MPALPQFAQLERRMNAAVTRHLANAMVQLAADGPAWAAEYTTGLEPDSPFAPSATAPQHTLSMCIVNLGDVAEGDELIVTTRQWPEGQRCRITTPVVPDAGGWATFSVHPQQG